MSIYTHDRSYVEYWLDSTGAVLKDEITGIMLRADTLRSEATFLALEHQIENFMVHVAEMDAKDESTP